MDELPEEMKEKLAQIDTTKISWPTYSYVARNAAFDSITNNQYKTVIGSLTEKEE